MTPPRRAKPKGVVDSVAIGKRIRELRGFYMHQKNFAAMLGVTQSQLSKYERGISEPPLAVLVKLKEEFGKSLDWLVWGEE
jgi:transcriptional regulator with XRE-family HTH domain